MSERVPFSSEGTLDEMLVRSGGLARQGRFDEALQLLHDTLEQQPDDARVLQLVQSVSSRAVDELIAQIGPLDRVPCPLGTLGPLSAEDAYVLERVDCLCTIDDLLHLSRLGRYCTLRSLMRLIEMGAIELGASGPVSSRAPQTKVLRLVPAQELERSMGLPAREQRAGRRLVLLVDDSPTHVALMQVLLGGADYAFVTALSGQQAIETAIATQPDLVVLGFMLAGYDGLEVARRLRMLDALATVPLLLTATRLEANFVRPRLAELRAGLILKPLQIAEISERVRTLLGKHVS